MRLWSSAFKCFLVIWIATKIDPFFYRQAAGKAVFLTQIRTQQFVICSPNVVAISMVLTATSFSAYQ
ncbi:MAG: hypothetical protein ACSLEL_05315 [Candidatus Malihini olakiniferum]